MRQYTPDFIFDGQVIEVKGYLLDRHKNKLSKVTQQNKELDLEVWKYDKLKEVSLISYGKALNCCESYGTISYDDLKPFELLEHPKASSTTT